MADSRWVTPAMAIVGLHGGTPPLDAHQIDGVRDSLFGSGRDASDFRDIFSAVGAVHATRITEWQRHFTAVDARATFALFAYQPDDTIRVLAPEICHAGTWSTIVELYEVLFRLASAGTVGQVGAHDQRTGIPYLARARWLMLSLPFDPRTRGLITRADLNRGGGIDQICSDARRARHAWLAELGRIDDSPPLGRGVDPIAEAMTLAQVTVNTGSAAERITGSPPINKPDSTDRSVYRACIDDHLLPRFAWCAASRIAWRLMPLPARVTGTAGAVVFAVGVLISFAVPWTIIVDRTTQASLAAALGYLLITVSAALDPVASRPWLLRQPASAAIGILALAALTPSWWTQNPTDSNRPTLEAAVGLTAVSVGYLLVEARNHDAGHGWRFTGRVGIVTLLGLAHAFAASLIALRWLVPVVADVPDNGPEFTTWWTGGDPRIVQPWLLLMFATAWSFASGVFAQILWDDQPVTAPLAHVRWRGKE
jgi:hypothetical protein